MMDRPYSYDPDGKPFVTPGDRAAIRVWSTPCMQCGAPMVAFCDLCGGVYCADHLSESNHPCALPGDFEETVIEDVKVPTEGMVEL